MYKSRSPRLGETKANWESMKLWPTVWIWLMNVAVVIFGWIPGLNVVLGALGMVFMPRIIQPELGYFWEAIM